MVSTMLPRLERRSILTGAAVTIALAVPPALIGKLMSDRDSLEGSNWAPVLFFWIVASFFAGGYVAARSQPHAPLAHGAFAALLAYVVVYGIATLRQLLNDEDVVWLSVAFAALLASSTGTVGGIVANHLRMRESRAGTR